MQVLKKSDNVWKFVQRSSLHPCAFVEPNALDSAIRRLKFALHGGLVRGQKQLACKIHATEWTWSILFFAILRVRVLCLIQRKLPKSVLSVDDMLNLGLSLLAVGPPSHEVSDGKTPGAYETKPATENSPPATDLHYASIS